MPQAKCTNCEVRYFWRNKRHLVRQAHCPKCGQKLEPTSKNVNLRTIEITIVDKDHPFKLPKKLSKKILRQHKKWERARG